MLKILRNTYIAILALVIVCGCARDELTETTPTPQDEIFFAATSGKVTRAGESSLAKYIENFRIYGVKSDKLVFDNYVLWYDEEATQSNSSNWEYVGYDPVDNKLQTIKYWDFSAFPYTFWAIAGAERGEFVDIDESTGDVRTFSTYLTEENGEIPMLYYTKPTYIPTKERFSEPVTFEFIGAHSRIRFAFYETVPGYAVKDVKFHIGSETTQYTDCTVNGSFNTVGNLLLTYTNGATSDVVCDITPTEQATHHAFGSLNYTTAASGKLALSGGSNYLGVLSSAPTYAGNQATPGYYTNILPNEDNATPLSIKVDYVLESLDDSGQEIEITEATAVVPAQFCQWRSNYSYTYLFKITDDKLKPISFVAVGQIENTINNEQGTITTVDEYSITTHQKGDLDEEGIAYESSPYVAERPIEISVVRGDGSDTPVLDGTTDYVRIYHQTTVNEWVVETGTSEPVTSITYNAGMAFFEPQETGTYRIEYWRAGDAGYRSVKIVSIGAVLHGTGHTGTDLGNGGSENMEMELE